jgi:hypothetical protein
MWDNALAEARKVGLVNAPHLEEFAKRYVAAHPGPTRGADRTTINAETAEVAEQNRLSLRVLRVPR